MSSQGFKPPQVDIGLFEIEVRPEEVDACLNLAKHGDKVIDTISSLAYKGTALIEVLIMLQLRLDLFDHLNKHLLLSED